MSYTSLAFFIFVAVIAVIYFKFPIKKYQWTVLLAASYFFYLYAGYRYAAYILVTTVSTYYAALWIDRIAAKSKETLKAHKADWDKDQKKEFKAKTKQTKQLIVTLTVVLNLGILAFLKYYNFLAGSLNELLFAANSSFQAPALKLILPLGISFYTFQSIGYVIDVNREKVAAEKNLAKVALFVCYFPQIIQGPISFYDQLAHQLYEPHDFEFTRFKHGTELVLWGLFKKLVIADRAYIAINTVLDDYYGYSGTVLTFTIILYALQLYTDFSGGIDISRGVSQILGIELAQNFRRPYFATTINDYWRRWHITLGAWMKEYVFYPLALSKSFTGFTKRIKSTKFGATKAGAHIAKVLPTSFASLVVFFLVGVWHGANWKYVAFGIWNGGIIMLSTLLEPVFEQMTKKLRINTANPLFVLFQILRTFVIVAIGYVFDVAADFADSMYTFRMILTDQRITWSIPKTALGLHIVDYLLLLVCTFVLLAVSLMQEKHSDTTLRVMLDEKPFLIRYLVLLAGLAMLIIFGIYGPGYDAAAFVYMQF